MCCADEKDYQIFSVNKELAIPLFPYDSSSMSPLVYAISSGEFLLLTASAQGFGIGVFVSSKGEPIRGTLQWPAKPVGIVYHDPYIVSLLQNSTIQIHNIENQTLVQSIPMSTSHTPKYIKLTKFPMDLHSGEQTASSLDGGSINIVFGNEKEVFGLVMRSWDFQLAELFDAEKVDAALALLTKITTTEESESQSERRQIFYCRAAFAFYSKLDFDHALEYFKKCKLPPIYLIKIFLEDSGANFFAENDSIFAAHSKIAGPFLRLGKTIF